MNVPSTFDRRAFLKTLAAAGLATPLLGRKLYSAPPSQVLRHASFGAAGMAWADIQAICSNSFVELVAVAEVDLNRAKQVKAWFPRAKIYQDWRELLDKEAKNIDSVNVSVPDHMHAPIGLSAMQLGKHIYGQKPLAHDLHEVRTLTEYAQGHPSLVTQMGIQIHSAKPYRQAVALVQSGAIGKIKEVHSWSNKKWGDRGPPVPTGEAVPEGFNWDWWLGGCATRPFIGHGYYHPANWRKRLDFGTGTFGDMGCHIYDPVYESLALTAPLTLRSEGPAPDDWNWSIDAKIRYVFPGTRYTAGETVAVTWYDGDNRPPAEIMALATSSTPPPKDHEKAIAALYEQGSILIGTKGVMHLPHIATPRLFPEKDFKDYPLPQVQGTNHWEDWAEACLSGGKTGANFGYAGPLTETVLLGSVAVRFPNTTLEWDAPNLRFKNQPEANHYVRRPYRQGWQVGAL